MTQAFNLSQLANNVNTSGLLNAAAGLYNQTPVANGGTGVASVASGNILVGAGTAAMTALAGSATNDVVTWNGSAWVSAASAGSSQATTMTVYTSPAPWTKPATVKAVKVTVIGGGGGGAGGKGSAPGPNVSLPVGAGGGGGGAIGLVPAPSIPGPVTITVGTGGAGGLGTPASSVRVPGTPGNASSFGAFVSATGGVGGGVSVATAGGTGTTTPTILGVRGGYATSNDGTRFSYGGFGALSMGVMGFGADNVAVAGNVYGGGGGSQGTAPVAPVPSAGTANGAAGAAGVVIIEEFY